MNNSRRKSVFGLPFQAIASYALPHIPTFESPRLDFSGFFNPLLMSLILYHSLPPFLRSVRSPKDSLPKPIPKHSLISHNSIRPTRPPPSPRFPSSPHPPLPTHLIRQFHLSSRRRLAPQAPHPAPPQASHHL